MHGMRYGATVPIGHGFYGSTNQVGRGVLKTLNISQNRPDFLLASFSFGSSTRVETDTYHVHDN